MDGVPSPFSHGTFSKNCKSILQSLKVFAGLAALGVWVEVQFLTLHPVFLSGLCARDAVKGH